LTLFDLFELAVIPLRKSLEIPATVHGMPVDTYSMDHVSAAEGDAKIDLIDCHFIFVGILKEHADIYQERFLNLVKNEFSEILNSGISYIKLGEILGSETAALYFMALGSYYDLWRIIIPKDAGLDGADADLAAADGMITITSQETT